MAAVNYKFLVNPIKILLSHQRQALINASECKNFKISKVSLRNVFISVTKCENVLHVNSIEHNSQSAGKSIMNFSGNTTFSKPRNKFSPIICLRKHVR